jgi:uncharacterized protein (DUF885 family)
VGFSKRHEHVATAIGFSAIAIACATPPAPAPAPPPAPPTRTLPASAPPAATPDRQTPEAAFETLSNRLLDAWQAEDPGYARGLGLHQYDGKVSDCSRAGIERRIAELRQAERDLAAVDASKLGADQKLDLAILKQRVESTLFWLVDFPSWQKDPGYYQDLFGVNEYLDRDYAPLAERAQKLLVHEKAALAQIPHIRENVTGPLSKPIVETAIKIYKGYSSYLRGDVKKLVGQTGDAAFRADFEKTNEALAKAADELATWLEKEEAPRADASHVLGKARYQKLLLAQEGITEPLADFEARGRADLEKNKAAYEKLAETLKPKRLKASELMAEASRVAEQARQFLIDHHIVTLPTDERAIVKETPPFMRWNSAFLNGPGPYDKASLPAFYYITLPDPTWSKREQAEYVPTYGILISTTVHEVYPGHFVHGLWIKKAPTRVQESVHSYAFSEGWAHYSEQMMADEGFAADRPETRLGILSDALLRDCRYVVSIGIHTQGMTLDQAAARFEKDCHQDKATAREQANRGAFDPGYFAYTFGKLEIVELRHEAEQKLGSGFSLQRFHDELLSHGAPPVLLVRERVLADLARAR